MWRMFPVVVCLGTLLASCSTPTVLPTYEYRIESGVMATGKDVDAAGKRLVEKLSQLGRDGWVLPEPLSFAQEFEQDGSVTTTIWSPGTGGLFLMRRRK